MSVKKEGECAAITFIYAAQARLAHYACLWHRSEAAEAAWRDVFLPLLPPARGNTTLSSFGANAGNSTRSSLPPPRPPRCLSKAAGYSRRLVDSGTVPHKQVVKVHRVAAMRCRHALPPCG